MENATIPDNPRPELRRSAKLPLMISGGLLIAILSILMTLLLTGKISLNNAKATQSEEVSDAEDEDTNDLSAEDEDFDRRSAEDDRREDTSRGGGGIGSTIYRNQAYNASQQAVAQECNTYATMVIQWYKTPVAQGGKGQNDLDASDRGVIAQWCDFGDRNLMVTDNGMFTIAGVSVGNNSVTIIGCGTEKRQGAYPKVTATANLRAGNINTEVGTDSNGDPRD